MRALFEEIGKLFVQELQSNIKNQVDIRGRRFSPVATSTFKRLLNKEGSFLRTRLMFTGRFLLGAFKFISDENSVSVFVSEDMYPARHSNGSVTYADIVRMNNDGSSEVNPAINSPPLIFPNNENDIMMMKSWETALDMLEHAVQNGDIEEMLFR
ncbi:MAG: hypothetical protein EPO24_10870 [Bacteroidetes bacterium]|nr:MAG: hypothetical protein EPO24_10870 [Bacteroidota bacterium]